MEVTMIGIDLAKNVFQLHGVSPAGEALLRKKLSRGQFLRFMSAQSPAFVVMEACGGAHHWARELTALGHEVRLIAAQYVRPFVKRQKMTPPMQRLLLPRHASRECALSNPKLHSSRRVRFCFAHVSALLINALN
jgi:transposase